MAADNHTTIVGNLVDDPELRFTNNGIAVANLRVAVTQRIQQDGEWRDGDTLGFYRSMQHRRWCGLDREVGGWRSGDGRG